MDSNLFLSVNARKSQSGGSRAPKRGGTTSSSRRGLSSASSSSSRRRMPIEDPYDEEYDAQDDDFGTLGGLDHDYDGGDEEEDDLYEEEDYEEEYDDVVRPPSRRNRRGANISHSRRTPAPPSKRANSSRNRSGGGPPPSSSSRRSSRSSSGRSRSGRVVPYTHHRARPPQRPPSAFTRGLAALKDSIPDPSTLKDATVHSLAAAKSSTARLSSNLYRDIKGLTSSELEQVMLKATKPDDTPVKGQHVERLVGVTYQISGRYDLYDAVLRKLWSKMAEKDWRTTIKALYILHRFSADGAPDHQASLKARLRELRRTRDPKRKDKYFNSKQLLAGDSTPDNISYRAFLARYAHYVLLRAQCFGGMFAEIYDATPTRKKSKSSSAKTNTPPPPKPITSTCLKNEHLEASQMLLKAGVACSLKDDELSENTAIAMERVASDMIGLTTAVAKALNGALKSDDDSTDVDAGILKQWCVFYSEELLPKTKALVKSASPTLDAYGLFLPSRMGASVSQDLLQKGLKGVESAEKTTTTTTTEERTEEEEVTASSSNSVEEEEAIESEEEEVEEPEAKEEEAELGDYDEYEYDEYEEYDEE